MTYLEKEKTLIQRDENGNLLPVEVALALLPDKPLVKLIPMTKGYLQKMYSVHTSVDERNNIENEIMAKHCVQPSYTVEEIEFLKPEIYGALLTAVLSLSTGQDQEAIKNSAVQKVIDDAELLKKKSMIQN